MTTVRMFNVEHPCNMVVAGWPPDECSTWNMIARRMITAVAIIDCSTWNTITRRILTAVLLIRCSTWNIATVAVLDR